MFKGLIKKAAGFTLTGRVAWVLIGTLATAVAWAGWTQWRIGSLHEKLGSCQGGAQSVAKAAANNATAVEDCKQRLEREISDRLQAEQAERLANEQLETETAIRRDLAERERARRFEAYRDPACSEWAVDIVCNDAADSLRRAASPRTEGD